MNAAIRANRIHAEQIVLRRADVIGMNLRDFARADLWQGAARPDTVRARAVAPRILRTASANSAEQFNEQRSNAAKAWAGC